MTEGTSGAIDVKSLMNTMEICGEKLGVNTNANEEIRGTIVKLSHIKENIEELIESYNKYAFDRKTFIKIRDKLKSGSIELIEISELETYRKQLSRINNESKYNLNLENCMDELIKTKLDSERKRIRTEIREELYTYYEQKKNETNREFCTLLALLLLLLLVIILIMAWKADRIFCDSKNMDMVNKEL